MGAKPVAALTELIFDMIELPVPGILELVDHQCQYLGHRVVHTLHSTIAIWVGGIGSNFPNP